MTLESTNMRVKKPSRQLPRQCQSPEAQRPGRHQKSRAVEMLRTFSIGSPQSRLSGFEKRSLVGMICDNAGKPRSRQPRPPRQPSCIRPSGHARDSTQEFFPESEEIPSRADYTRTTIRGSPFALHYNPQLLSINSSLRHLDQRSDILCPAIRSLTEA